MIVVEPFFSDTATFDVTDYAGETLRVEGSGCDTGDGWCSSASAPPPASEASPSSTSSTACAPMRTDMTDSRTEISGS